MLEREHDGHELLVRRGEPDDLSQSQLAKSYICCKHREPLDREASQAQRR